MDLDPDPDIFVIDLQDATKNIKKGSAYYILKVHLHHFSKVKCQKEVAKQKESRFFLLFLLGDKRIASGSAYRSGARSGSVSVPLTNGSGSRRPKTYESDGTGSGFGSGSATLLICFVYVIDTCIVLSTEAGSSFV